MEVDNVENTMQNFNIPNIVGNLKITCNVTASKFVLWSKYQLFVKDKQRINSIDIEPPFEIKDVIILNDCLVCLDWSENVNISSSINAPDCVFFIWNQNIKSLFACEYTGHLICLQHEQQRALKLVVGSINNGSSSQGSVLKLPVPYNWWTPENTCILVCAHIESNNLNSIKKISFKAEEGAEYLLIIISLDKKNIYYYVLNVLKTSMNGPQNYPENWLKLYNSYTDIVDIKINVSDAKNMYALAGLAGGNIVKIPLSHNHQKPEVYHLNATINKFIMVGDTIIYSDVMTMWKNENVFSKTDSVFKQFVVRNIRDFCIMNNLVICVTFSNIIYCVDINHRSSYVASHDTDDSFPVQMITNSGCLQRIMEVVQTNEELLKKINKERECLMALSLSRRQDVMNDLIQVETSVFDNFRDIASKNNDLTLTDDAQAYYDSESYYFLINIVVNRIQHKLNRMLSDVLGDIKMHITLLTHGLLKTTSIHIKGQLTTRTFVMSIKKENRNITRMQVHVRIVTNIPGKYDENQRHCCLLYQKCIDLTAENFVNIKACLNGTLLRQSEQSLEVLIYKRVKHLYGTDYKFHFANDERYQWKLFIKLPEKCNLHMKDFLGLIGPMDSKRAYTSLKHLMCSLKEKNCLEFEIGKEPVRLEIKGGNIEVTCPNLIVASDIRDFFSSIIFNAFKDNFKKEIIPHKYYSILESRKRNINIYIGRKTSREEFAELLTRFLRNLHCMVPI